MPENKEPGAEGALLVLAAARDAFQIEALIQCPSCLRKTGWAGSSGLELRLENDRLTLRCMCGCGRDDILSAAASLLCDGI